MIRVHNQEEIRRLRTAAAINAAAHRAVAATITSGITTRELEHAALAAIKRWGAVASFAEEFGFPSGICVSVNEEAGHGVPGDRRLRDGDLVKVDIGVTYAGMHSDAARTHAVGDVPPLAKQLLEATRKAMWRGISAAQTGRPVSDISFAVAQAVQSAGFATVKTAFGHGIGESLHEDPAIANFGPPGLGPRLRPGMAICIEPVVTSGRGGVRRLPNGWTDVTVDRSLAAHFEHTILVTTAGPKVLTAVDPKEAGDAPCWVGEGEPLAEHVYCRSMRPGEEKAVFAQVAAEMDPVLMEAFGRRALMSEVTDIPDTQVVVAETHPGQLVGCFVIGRRALAMHLYVLTVAGASQSRGLGRRVMTLLEQAAATAGCTKLTLCVQTTNTRALNFYRRLGYQSVGRSCVNTLDMEKSLCS